MKRLRKGDIVEVLTGKDRGRRGKILRVFPDDGRVIVERVMVVKRHQRPTRTFQGGIVEKPRPIDLSNVVLICPKCSSPTRPRPVQLEEKKVRQCKDCGETIDKV